ncbi:MAG: hypothetical protein KDE63_03225 [Novosphingobium sp.]|nr:hypothetical protein [Novosphingobium sp.]
MEGVPAFTPLQNWKRPTQLWSAITGVEWVSPGGGVVTYPLRKAGEVIAWIREEGDYLDWYCCGPQAQVAPWIEETLKAEGWARRTQ